MHARHVEAEQAEVAFALVHAEPTATLGRRRGPIDRTDAEVGTGARAIRDHAPRDARQHGAQQVIVPSNIPIVMAVDGDRSLLVAGQYAVIAVTTDAGGKITATRVQITKDGVKPPQ